MNKEPKAIAKIIDRSIIDFKAGKLSEPIAKALNNTLLRIIQLDELSLKYSKMVKSDKLKHDPKGFFSLVDIDKTIQDIKLLKEKRSEFRNAIYPKKQKK